jgi:hypothetical protein
MEALNMRESFSVGLKVVIIFLVLAMVGNVLMLARSFELLRFPGEITDTEIVRGGARVLAAYYEKTIADAGLSRNSAVRDALAKFKFEIEQAASGEEISQVIWAYGREVQDVIAREEENQRREFVLWVVNQDPAIKEIGDKEESVALARPRALEGLRLDTKSAIIQGIVMSEVLKRPKAFSRYPAIRK